MINLRNPIFLILILTVSLSGCIVSKKDYLLKEDEAKRCTENLARQVQEDKTLRDELSSCQRELSSSKQRVEELNTGLSYVSDERDLLVNKLTVQQAVNEELKAQNARLSDILQEKEVSQSSVIRETMEISKRLQGTNTELREKLAVREAELKRARTDMAAAQSAKEKELEKLKATYDELVNSLKGEIEAGEIQIRRMKDRLSVNLVEKILFDSGKANLKGSGIEVLRKVGAQLARIEDKRIQIEGHSDNVPIGGKLRERFPTNWELSASRALAVVHFLQDEVGIDGQKLSGAGYGEYQPAASNDTVDGKAANRRIEIVLLPPYERTSEAQESTE